MRSTRLLLCAGAGLLAALPVAAQKPPAKPAAKPSAAASTAVGPALPSKVPLASPYLIVNGVTIPVSEYIDRMSMAFGGQMREALVEEALVRSEAKKRKITATPADIDSLVKQVIASGEGQYGSAKGLDDELKKTRGWSREDYLVMLRQQAAVQVLRNKIAASLVPVSTVKDEEVEARYNDQRAAFAVPDSVRISHILIRRNTGEAADAEARKKAEGVLKRVQDSQGKDFAKIAKDESDDRNSGAQGGTIPIDVIRGGNSFGAQFDAVVFSAPVGVIDQVIPTPLGYHIIRVDSRKEGRQMPLSEVRTQVRDVILSQKRREAYEELFVRLRTAAKVEAGKV